MFEIKIKTGNAAFGDDAYEATYEINRLLEEVSHKLRMGYTEGNLMDINGNKGGTFKLDFDK